MHPISLMYMHQINLKVGVFLATLHQVKEKHNNNFGIMAQLKGSNIFKMLNRYAIDG